MPFKSDKQRKAVWALLGRRVLEHQAWIKKEKEKGTRVSYFGQLPAALVDFKEGDYVPAFDLEEHYDVLRRVNKRKQYRDKHKWIATSLMRSRRGVPQLAVEKTDPVDSYAWIKFKQKKARIATSGNPSNWDAGNITNQDKAHLRKFNTFMRRYYRATKQLV